MLFYTVDQILFFFSFFLSSFFLKIIYLSVREHKQGEQQAEREAGFWLGKESDAGIDPRTL